MVDFLDAATAGELRRTPEGYLVGVARVARTGVQTYLKSELGLTGEGTIGVYRAPGVVFDAASLETYRGKPITVGHPKEPVTTLNWKQHAVGTIGTNVGRTDDTVAVDFSIMDAEAVAAVESGVRQFSLGYSTNVELRDGVAENGETYGAVITGLVEINHLALVRKARGGDRLRIGDEEAWGASPVEQKKEDDMTTKVVILGDASVSLPESDAAIVVAFKDAMNTAMGELRAKVAELTGQVMTPTQLQTKIRSRVDLERTASKFLKDTDLTGMDDDAIRKAVVMAALGDELVKDASPAELLGMYRVASAKAPQNDDSQDGGRDMIRDAASKSPKNANGWDDTITSAGLKLKKGA